MNFLKGKSCFLICEQAEAKNFNAKDITLGKNMKKITKYILPVETALNRRTLDLSEMFRK